MQFLLLGLLIIPALEIGIFIWVGGMIGPWWVVFLILLTGFLGLAIARHEGMDTWKKAMERINNGKMPATEIMDGICILIGAIFLFTPGFLTDTVGFLLVLPFTRIPFRNLVGRFMKQKIKNGTIFFRH